MRTYTIHCNEGTEFCSWSLDEPPTRAQIIEHFNQFRITEGMEIPKKALTLRAISAVWNVDIKKCEAI